MVTIEQKLILFEKLIQHDIFETSKDERSKKEEYYANLVVKSKDEIDKISREMKIEEGQKLNRIAIKEEAQVKKVYENSFLKTKAELLSRVLSKIEEEIYSFTKTDNYKKYIETTIDRVYEEIDFDKDIIIFMTKGDIQIYGDYIVERLNADNTISISLDEEKDSIMGGIIVKTIDESMRYDFSLKRNLEESMDIILKGLNDIIEEGDIV